MPRFFRHLILLAALWLPFNAQAAPRIATSDWSVAETLTAMKLPPIGVGDKRAYQFWVSQPALPDQTLDAGLRFQPNLERLYQLKPDRFIQSSWFAHLKPQFEQIAPVSELDFADDKGIRFEHTVAATRTLGKMVGAEAAAEQLIRSSLQSLVQARHAVAPYRSRPLAVVQFIDSRHLRIYGESSLYHAVMNQLGLQNAWRGESNAWGFANIPLTRLAQLPPGTLLIIVPPHPPLLHSALQKNAIWQRLPFAQSANRRVLERSWSYGALPSMTHFAGQLAEYLPKTQERPW